MTELNDDVSAFLRAHVTSVMQLEVLLHLRARAQHAVDPTHLSRELGGSVDSAIGCLLDLERSGLVARSDDPGELCYRYAPRDAALGGAVDAVADAYAKRKVAVVTAIFTEPADDLRSFSDAFRIRKDKRS